MGLLVKLSCEVLTETTAMRSSHSTSDLLWSVLSGVTFYARYMWQTTARDNDVHQLVVIYMGSDILRLL